MRRLICILLFVAAAGAETSRDESRAIFAEIDRTLDELAKISGLRLHKKVPSDLISKDKVNEFLKKKVKEVSSPNEVRAEELTLKKFGLVPQDFDLAQTTVDVLTEQAAAFYDYHAKKLFITDWTPSATREAAPGARTGARAGRSELQSQALHPEGARERRRSAGAHGRDGRTGDLADVGVPGAQTGETLVHNPALAERMNRMSDSDSGGRVSGFRRIAALHSRDADFPLHQRHEFPAGRGG